VVPSTLFVALNEEFPRAETNALGRFVFDKLPAGEYIIVTGSSYASDIHNRKTYLQDQSGAVLTMKVKLGDVMDLGRIQVSE